jgi:hypothetical protein
LNLDWTRVISECYYILCVSCVLIAAQALGDRQALLDNERRVIRFHLGDDVVGGLKKLSEAL